MTWVFAILVVLVLGGVAAAAAGRGSGLAEDDDLVAGPTSREVPLDASGLRAVRFPLALRGYRMADVDALLDRLAAREEARQQEAERPSDP
ncbi:hypothetical protein GCM10009737_20180 [Nocardioides lentus]|uniref:DivIVA domain-containing protein n=1 Tax=Nocardioides lentus TaxID=338077 RepID=A0ABP5AS15_9ACTN